MTTVFVMLRISPFSNIYKVDIKLASIFIFGWIGVAEPAIDVFLSIPLANLVERYCRRKTAYLGHMVGMLARLMLVLTPPSLPMLLILVSVPRGLERYLYLGMDAYSQEIIPQRIRGSYTGLKSLIVGVAGIASPVIGGICVGDKPRHPVLGACCSGVSWPFLY